MLAAKGLNELALRFGRLPWKTELWLWKINALARTLYAQVELGQVVPADLYKAVAEILAFVYQLNKRKKRYLFRITSLE
jgi:flagellar biosynthetic protein FlhB